MSWAYGVDSRGKEVGYSVTGTCEHSGCTTEITRSVGAACGGMHGDDEQSCGGHFCDVHLNYRLGVDGDHVQVCAACAESLWASCPECDGETFDENGDDCGCCFTEGTVFHGGDGVAEWPHYRDNIVKRKGYHDWNPERDA